MSQEDFVSELGVMYISPETTFAVTPGTYVRQYPVAGTIKLSRSQENIDVNGLKARPWDKVAPVLGRKACKLSFEYYVQPDPTRLVSAATPATANPISAWLAPLCGLTAFVGAAGDTVVSGGTSTGCTVSSGTKFPEGQLSLLNTTGSTWDPIRITGSAANAITWWPATTGAASPANAQVICNMMTFYPTRTNSKSLSARVCSAISANEQFELLGLTGSFGISFKLGELPKFMVDLEGTTYTGPSAAGYTITHSDDYSEAPFSTVGAVCYFQDASTSTRTGITIDEISVKYNLGNALVDTLTGGVQNKRAVARTKDLDKPAAEIELTIPWDLAYEALYTAQTTMGLMVSVQATHSTGVRVMALDFPRCRIVEAPDFEATGSDGLQKVKLKLQVELDGTNTAPYITDEQALAPWRIGIG